MGDCRHSNWPSLVGPHSLCNRMFCGVLFVVTLILEFSVGVRAFVIWLSQMSSFVSYYDMRLSNKTLTQRYVKSSLRKLYGLERDFIHQYEVFLSRTLHGILGQAHSQLYPLSIRHYNNSWSYYLTFLLNLTFLPYSERFRWSISNGCVRVSKFPLSSC